MSGKEDGDWSPDSSEHDGASSSKKQLSSLVTSPPSYSVVETPSGHLVSPALGVEWPNRPAKGYYSTKAYIKRKEKRRFFTSNVGHQRKHRKHEKHMPVCPSSRSPDSSCSDNDLLKESEEEFRRQRYKAESSGSRRHRRYRSQKSYRKPEFEDLDRSARKMKKDDAVGVGESYTPPCYAVCETRSGRLVSPALGVEWPNRPEKGYHSMKAHLERTRAPRREVPDHRRSPENVGRYASQETNHNKKYDRMLYLGAQMRAAVAKRLKQKDFAIYYPIDNQQNSEIATRIPLVIGYRDSNGKLYEFPLICKNSRWQIELRGQTMPTFCSVTELIDHHRSSTYMNKHTGQVDMLPVWKCERKCSAE